MAVMKSGGDLGSTRVSRVGFGVPPKRTSRRVELNVCVDVKFAVAGRPGQQPGRLRYPEHCASGASIYPL